MTELDYYFYRNFVAVKLDDKIISPIYLDKGIYDIVEDYFTDEDLKNWKHFIESEKASKGEDFDKWLSRLTFKNIKQNGYIEQYNLPERKLMINLNKEAKLLGEKISDLLDRFYAKMESFNDETICFGYSVCADYNCIEFVYIQLYDIENKTFKNGKETEKLVTPDTYKETSSAYKEFEKEFENILQDFTQQRHSFSTSFKESIISHKSTVKSMDKSEQQEYDENLKDNLVKDYRVVRYMEADIFNILSGESPIDVFNRIVDSTGKRGIIKTNNEYVLNQVLSII